MDFGQQLSHHRKQAGLTLQSFSKLIGYDSSNISKVERGISPPPPATIALKKWAMALKLEPGTTEYNNFVSTGLATKIKRRFKTDEEIEALMPAFFRTVGNKEVDPDTYERLKVLLRKNL